MKMHDSIAWVTLLALLVLITGCRDRQQPVGQDESAPPTGAVTAARSVESANVLAERALAAMDRREFANAAELYQRAVQVRQEQTDELFDMQCKGMLACWLAGDVKHAAALANRVDWPDSRQDGRHAYLNALCRAMSVYVYNGWPTQEVERKLDVLPMALGLQLYFAAFEEFVYEETVMPMDGSEPEYRPVNVRLAWREINLLPAMLVARAAMDSRQRDLRQFQVVTLMHNARLPASMPDREECQPDDPLAFHWRVPRLLDSEEHFAQVLAPPVVGDQPSAVSEWLGRLASEPSRWLRGCETPGYRVRIVIGVRKGAAFPAAVWVAVDEDRLHDLGGTISFKSAAEAQRFASGLKVVKSAMPDGATPIATRAQAEMVVEALARFVGRSRLARVQPQDDFFWVLPAGPGGGQWIPLVAGWLAGRDWRPASGPAPDSQPEAIEIEPINPPAP